MITDCQINLTGRLSPIELAEFNEATERLDNYLVLASPKLAMDPGANEVLGDFLSTNTKAIGFGVVNPLVKEGQQCPQEVTEKWGIKGFALYCSKHGFHPADSQAMRFYEYANENSMPIYFYMPEQLDPTDILEYGRPYLIDEIARNFPDMKIIISNCGVPFQSETVAVLAKNKNVYSTLPVNPSKWYQTYTLLVRFFEGEAINKLLFASNYPSHQPNECLETLLGFNRMIANTQLPVVPLDEIRKIVNANVPKKLSIDLSAPPKSEVVDAETKEPVAQEQHSSSSENETEEKKGGKEKAKKKK
ncbi:amidohydrolase family protein [Sedimentisphaera salicampi]|uniref:amidohydrolase family protein n=1 Tax=Sedimentisphaera salicampi TaxID=1941349 RepID=UPI000B9BEA6F|nr:amidohydrolase family protein [Sedimentisphaera salicampi]OXU14809.1 putative metal-dependent hydrolase of the TIM-barrel fold protein [Sedimentisphaera salicampi]